MRTGSLVLLWVWSCGAWAAEDFPKPYSTPCTEREGVFEFTEKPKMKNLGNDKYEITFAVKANCDVTAGLIDEKGVVVRHLGSGVLGAKAPAPFQKNSLKQTIYWNGKDDLDEYVKEPGKLRVRVRLGLKPEFDKRLGGTSPKNVPGYVWGLVTSEDGVYVFAKGGGTHGNLFLRRFDHDGKYLASLLPPPANVPEERLQGMGYVEYEKGVKAPHGPDLYETVANNGFLFSGVGGFGIASCQPVIVGEKIYFSNGGPGAFAPEETPSLLFHVQKDGSLEPSGVGGEPFVVKFRKHVNPRLALSPDGKWLYIGALGATVQYSSGNDSVVLRRALSGVEPAKVFIGTLGKPGSDNQSFNDPQGIDCDAQGRLYVCDFNNNRIQVFSSEGAYLKTIAAARPMLVQVHRKTGGIYVKHGARVQGRLVERLTKFKSFDDPREEMHQDGIEAALLAVDSWTAKPRLWLAGSGFESHTAGTFGRGPGATVWEEESTGWRKIIDFDEDAKSEAGQNYLGRWHGGISGKVACDPVQESLYYDVQHQFDLKTGARVGDLRLPGQTDDIAFDKRGYLHAHFNPGFFMPGVARFDPLRTREKWSESAAKCNYEEVPYDYGEERQFYARNRLEGVLPVKDQPGAKFFQEGLGVNMRGEIAVESNIYYVPKMEEASWQEFTGGGKRGGYAKLSNAGQGDGSYAGWVRKIEELQKRGEAVYSIRRIPGVFPVGGTIWTFDRSGELRQECAVVTGRLINGAQIDEDGNLYFVTNRQRMFGDRIFLEGRGGILGKPRKEDLHPFTGTLVKARDKGVCLLTVRAPIPLDAPPARPAELMDSATPTLFGKDYRAWMEGAEWFYAGASPITCNTCACPQQRLHTDWYKRTYVPEAYRHSIGVVDTAGNLIMHIGRYGNLDSGDGPKSKIPVGGDGIGMFLVRFVSGTDNYLVFDDYGERLVTLKLNYHAEETVGIQ